MSNFFKIKIFILAASLSFAGGMVLAWHNHSSSQEISATGGFNSVFQLSKKGLEEVGEVEKNAVKDIAPVKITFLGDLMFDRYIRQAAAKKGNDFIFEKISPKLRDNDLVVANLEGPITDSQSVSVNSRIEERNHFLFTFDPSLAETLAQIKINLVNLGNNHILNFKEGGVKQTERYLSKAGIKYFGSPVPGNRFQVVAYSCFRIAFVNYNQFEYQGKEKALEDIQKAKDQADLVILYTHWGKEYETEPLQSVKSLAHQFIDSGADLIIGSHPHVVQGKEFYKNKTIYYSLGNFIFDQYFQPETTEGLAVKAIINPNDKSIKFEEISLKLQNNGQTILK